MYAVMELRLRSAWCRLFQSCGRSRRERVGKWAAIKKTEKLYFWFFFLFLSALGKKVDCVPSACPPVLLCKCFSWHGNYALCDIHRFCVDCSFVQTSAFQTPATFQRKPAHERSPQTAPAALFSGVEGDSALQSETIRGDERGSFFFS